LFSTIFCGGIFPDLVFEQDVERGEPDTAGKLISELGMAGVPR
jgi:hypothetical protein